MITASLIEYYRFRSLFDVDFRNVCSTESMNSTLNASDEGIALNRRGMEVAKLGHGGFVGSDGDESRMKFLLLQK